MKPTLTHHQSNLPKLVAGSLAALTIAAGLIIAAPTRAHAQGLWHHSVFGPPFTGGSPAASLVDGEGDLIITGLMGDASVTDDVTAAFNHRGDLLWERAVPVNNDKISLALDSEGNIVVLIASSTAVVTYLKYSPAGELMENVAVTLPVVDADGGGANGVLVGRDDSLYVYSNTYKNKTNDYLWSLTKLSPAGDVIWNRIYPSPSHDPASSFVISGAIDGDDDVILVGSVDTPAGPRFTVAKFDPASFRVFQHVINTGDVTVSGATAVTVDSSSNIYVAGNETTGTAESGLLTMKLTPQGQEVWHHLDAVVPRAQGYAQAERIVLDRSGDVVIAGLTEIANQKAYRTLVKYDNQGNRLWVNKTLKYYDDKYAAGDDMTFGLFSDANDNLFLADYIEAPDLAPNPSRGFYRFVTSSELSPSGDATFEQDYFGPADELYTAIGETAAFDPATDTLYTSGVASYLRGNDFEDDWFTVANQP